MNSYFIKAKKVVSKLSEMALARSINKQDNYWHSKFIKRQRYLEIFMDVNNVCNLACIMCSRDSKHKVINMTPEEFNFIGEKCFRYAEKLQISCAWEMSISKYSSEILRILPSFEIPKTSVYTNGNVMKSELINAIFESGLTEIVFSIGESDAQTYSKIRKKGNHEKVLGNIRAIARRKSQKQLKNPYVGANLTCMKSNIEELPSFVRMASDVGIEFIRGRHLILLEGLDMKKESLIDTISKTNDIINESKEIAKKYNISFHVPLLDKEVRNYVPCNKPWTNLYISSNGDLSICPRISQFELLGNLLTDDFEEIYYQGKAIKDLRKSFIDQNYNKLCRICIKGLVEREEISQKF